MIAAGQYRIVVPASQWDAPWSLWPLGDIHWWNAACDEAAADETLAAIADDPMSRVIGMGDYSDLIGHQDKRFDGSSIAPSLVMEWLKSHGSSARDHLIEKFSPIKSQIVGLHLGNHEWKYANVMENPIVQDACKAMGVRFLGYSAFTDIVFVRRGSGEEHGLRIFSHHGAGYALTKGGKINRLERFMDDQDADIYLIGHLHECLDDEKVRLGANADCTKLTARTRLGVMTGTYLRTYQAFEDGASTYGERAGYRPTPIGTPRISIIPETGRLAVEKPKGHLQWRS